MASSTQYSVGDVWHIQNVNAQGVAWFMNREPAKTLRISFGATDGGDQNIDLVHQGDQINIDCKSVSDITIQFIDPETGDPSYPGVLAYQYSATTLYYITAAPYLATDGTPFPVSPTGTVITALFDEATSAGTTPLVAGDPAVEVVTFDAVPSPCPGVADQTLVLAWHTNTTIPSGSTLTQVVRVNGVDVGYTPFVDTNPPTTNSGTETIHDEGGPIVLSPGDVVSIWAQITAHNATFTNLGGGTGFVYGIA